MSRVFSMEPEGITRAWPMVPLMSKNTSATQNQAMISRCTFCPTGTLGCASLLGLGSAFMFHRHGIFDWTFTSVAVHRVTCLVRIAFAHFQLHQVRRIDAGVAGGAIVALRVADSLLQSGQRNVAQRIGSDEFADFFRRAGGGDQLFARRRVHAVITRRNRGWTTDAHVHFFGAGFAYHADDFAAGGAAHNGVVHQHDALTFNQAADRVELQLHAKIADGLRRLDERASNVVIVFFSMARRNPRFTRIPHTPGPSRDFK